MQPNYRGLAFLLSLGSLPLACSTKDDNETDGGSSSGGGTNPSTTGTDATDPTEASDTTTTGATTTGASATMTSTGSEDDTGIETQPTTAEDTGTDTGVPTPTDPVCIAYGEHYAGCFPPRYGVYADVLAANCEYVKGYGMVDGQACIDALDALFVCLTMTDCAALMDEDMPPCGAQEDAVLAACPTLSDGDTDT